MEQTSYKLINTRPFFFGIEFMHGVVIASVFIVFYIITSSFFFVLALCSGLYLLSRLVMAQKAREWLEDLFSYHFGPKEYTASFERKER